MRLSCVLVVAEGKSSFELAKAPCRRL